METQPLGPPLWFTGNEMSLSGVSQLPRIFAVTLPACPAQVTPLEPLMPPVLESSDCGDLPASLLSDVIKGCATTPGSSSFVF